MKRFITMITIAIMLTKGDLTTAEEISLANPTHQQNELGPRRNLFLFDYTLKTEEEVNASCGDGFYLVNYSNSRVNYIGWSSFLSIEDRFLTIYPSKDQATYFRKCSSPWKAGTNKKNYMQAMYKGTGYWLTYSGSSMFLKSIFHNDPNFGISDENSPVQFKWTKTRGEKPVQYQIGLFNLNKCWISKNNGIIDYALVIPFWWVPGVMNNTETLVCPYLDFSNLIDKRLYFESYSDHSSRYGKWWHPVDVNQDCAGTWSSCTSKCETAGERKFTQTQPKWGSGAACPAAANDCDHAEGECKTGNKK